jgi:hypothetical protein
MGMKKILGAQKIAVPSDITKVVDCYRENESYVDGVEVRFDLPTRSFTQHQRREAMMLTYEQLAAAGARVIGWHTSNSALNALVDWNEESVSKFDYSVFHAGLARRGANYAHYAALKLVPEPLIENAGSRKNYADNCLRQTLNIAYEYNTKVIPDIGHAVVGSRTKGPDNKPQELLTKHLAIELRHKTKGYHIHGVTGGLDGKSEPQDHNPFLPFDTNYGLTEEEMEFVLAAVKCDAELVVAEVENLGKGHLLATFDNFDDLMGKVKDSK